MPVPPSCHRVVVNEYLYGFNCYRLSCFRCTYSVLSISSYLPLQYIILCHCHVTSVQEVHILPRSQQRGTTQPWASLQRRDTGVAQPALLDLYHPALYSHLPPSLSFQLLSSSQFTSSHTSMSFFKRKEKALIPPVADPVSSRGPSPGGAPPSYRSNASTYVPSRDGDPYSSAAPSAPSGYSGGAGYNNRGGSVGDVYTRGQKNIEQDRGELFAGYNPEKAGSGRFFNESPGMRGGPRGGEPAPGEENEEDVEGIKQQLRYTKQESVNSTRNALRLAREAEETARNTLGRLGDQSGMSDARMCAAARAD